MSTCFVRWRLANGGDPGSMGRSSFGRYERPSMIRMLGALCLLAMAQAAPGASDERPLPQDTLPARIPLRDIPAGLDSARPIPADNELIEARVQLGRRLFFDPLLSVDHSISCASCHDPAHGFASADAVAIGVHGRRALAYRRARWLDRAGAARLPFGLLRGYIGTDLPAHNPRIRSVRCPYTDEEIATVPAINPDVTILHAQRADRQGNVAIAGITGASREAALAAARLLVTVEEIVEAFAPAMNGVLLPHFTVTAISHCPGGAWPSYAHGYYARDNDFYLRWDTLARDRKQFTDWIDRHVRGTADHRAFLASES